MELTKTASVINDYFHPYSKNLKLINILNSVVKNNDYDDFAMYEWLKLHEVVCIFLDLHPEYINAYKHPKYNTIFNALERYARDNQTAKGIRIERSRDFLNTFFDNESDFEIFLSHDFARAWSNVYGLNWNVPKYKAIQLPSDTPTANTEETTELHQQLEQAQEEIAQLKKQIEELQFQQIQLQANEQKPIVDYEDYSIYGHTTKEIKALFATVKKFWINHDINEPDTIAKADHIVDWIKNEYGISEVNAIAIQKMTRPLKAKNLGVRPNR